MKLDRKTASLVALAMAGMPLATVGTCDPYTGVFNVLRFDTSIEGMDYTYHNYDDLIYYDHYDSGYYHYDYFYDYDYYYDDPYWGDCGYIGCW